MNGMKDIPLDREVFIGYIGQGIAKPGKNAPQLVHIMSKKT
jgi:hypothetical protein